MEDLLEFLACPVELGQLRSVGGTLQCAQCQARYPIDEDGIISFLGQVEESAASWDAESDRYAEGFARYTDEVEIPATVGRLAAPLVLPLPVTLDHGCGTGRMTAALQRHTGHQVLALDYSRENLRRVVRECGEGSVLAIHADARRLPIRSGCLGGVVSAGVYPLLRAEDRQLLIEELARVLHPDGQLVLSTLNYSWVFRLWRLRGNRGAREGAHLYGQEIYYRRQTARELRRELAWRFEVDGVYGIRNIPVRTLEMMGERVLGARRASPVVRWMHRVGPRLDRSLEASVISRLTGFMMLARARPRRQVHPSAVATASRDHSTSTT